MWAGALPKGSVGAVQLRGVAVAMGVQLLCALVYVAYKPQEKQDQGWGVGNELGFKVHTIAP